MFGIEIIQALVDIRGSLICMERTRGGFGQSNATPVRILHHFNYSTPSQRIFEESHSLADHQAYKRYTLISPVHVSREESSSIKLPKES